MTTENEVREVARVTARLQVRFPELEPTTVEDAVRLSHSMLTGPVRDFVPILVERSAAERLTVISEGRRADANGRRDHLGDPAGTPPRPGTPRESGHHADRPTARGRRVLVGLAGWTRRAGRAG